MQDEGVNFLDACRHIAGHDDLMIGESAGQAAAFAQDGNGPDSVETRRMQRGDQIGGVSTCAENHEDVPGLPQRFDLTGKDCFEPEIVGDTSQSDGIRAQRESGQSPAIPVEASGQLFGEMQSVRRASAISGRQHLAPAKQCFGKSICGRPHSGKKGLKAMQGSDQVLQLSGRR